MHICKEMWMQSPVWAGFMKGLLIVQDLELGTIYQKRKQNNQYSVIIKLI